MKFFISLSMVSLEIALLFYVLLLLLLLWDVRCEWISFFDFHTVIINLVLLSNLVGGFYKEIKITKKILLVIFLFFVDGFASLLFVISCARIVAQGGDDPKWACCSLLIYFLTDTINCKILLAPWPSLGAAQFQQWATKSSVKSMKIPLVC